MDIQTLADPGRMVDMLGRYCAPTGSNYFYEAQANRDYDYIVPFSLMYEYKANYDMATIANGCGSSGAFGNFKFRYRDATYDLIIVSDAECEVWRMATAMFPAHMLPRRDKIRRVKLFELLKSAAREFYGYPTKPGLPPNRGTI